MELSVYKASAGSGKTFTLTVEYIRHLIADPRAYRQILAVTFTNKATAEMKERILTQLYGIWKGDPASDAYLQCIRQRMDNPPHDTLLRQQAGTALLYMLHDYNRFRVETIDSFFQSVMRNLARELELAPNLNIELDNSQVLDNAVDTLIEKLTPQSPVLQQILDYIGQRIASDKRWNISDEVKRFGQNIFDEGYMERGGALRQKLQHPDTIRLYRELLKEMETEALEQMKGFSDQFDYELESHGLQADELKGGRNGIGSYFRKLRAGTLGDKEVVNQTVLRCLDDAEQWTAKTSTRRQDIITLARERLIPLLEQAEKLRPQRNATVNSCRLSMQHLDKLQLLNHIDEEVRTQNSLHNRFLLSDTNALLHRLVGDGDSSFVFEKTGATLRNVMIDEFQDTSRMQWKNFRLLLLEGLSQGADSLIVGDVKQSIYRWRNGDWSILNNLGRSDGEPAGQTQATGRFPVRIRTLKVNRRSEAGIIRFNNRFFTCAVSHLNHLHQEELGEECLPLKQAYADVEQETARPAGGGYVKVAFAGSGSSTYEEQTLLALGDELQRLLASGIRPGDIAILVRKNKNIPAIAEYLGQQMHLQVVSDEAFRLDASETVCMLADALRYLSRPDDPTATISTGISYLHPGSDGTGICWHRLFTAAPDALLPQALVNRRDELRLMPLYDLAEELYTLLQADRMEQQDAYVMAFFDAVAEYLQDHPSDIGAFVRHWDETLCRQTIPGGEADGIRIMSIHKSKGLEFHTVLIPFCDWKMENETNNQLVWCHPTAAPYDSLDLVPVNYSAAMAESVYRDAYLDERLQLWVDNLNLLYVAFTRAGRNLIVWSRSERQQGCMAELLADAMQQMDQEDGGTARTNNCSHLTEADITECYEWGTLSPSVNSRPDAENGATPATIAENGNRLAVKPLRQPIRMKSMKHNIDFRQSNRSADFLAGSSEEQSQQRFMNRGRLLHALFSDIATPDDIDPAIDRLVAEGIIGDAATEQEIRTLTRRAFALPQVREWYDGSWQLFSERDIIWMEGGTLHTRRPDRVMTRGSETVVIDFKFGRPKEEYNRQVRSYMQLLQAMGRPAEEMHGYLWYVDNDKTEEV